MNYFQEYEKLKAANQLLTPGSIWKDNIGEVKIVHSTKRSVYFSYRDFTDDLLYDLSYNKYDFIKHFHRIS